MEAEEIRRLLITLLEDSGAAWAAQGGCICFRLAKNGAVWEMACRCIKGRLLAYGRYPFAAADRAQALRLCSEVNSQVVQGAMFLQEDGRAVFRTDAALPDLYDASRLMREAIEYNAAVICRFWRGFSPEHPTL